MGSPARCSRPGTCWKARGDQRREPASESQDRSSKASLPPPNPELPLFGASAQGCSARRNRSEWTMPRVVLRSMLLADTEPSATRRSTMETTGRDSEQDRIPTVSDDALVGEWVELALEAPNGNELGRMLRNSEPEEAAWRRIQAAERR